jgi:L-lactate dehydrogenase complex protein LldE
LQNELDVMQNGTGATYASGDSVALFVPCYVDVLYPEVAKAVVSIFDRLGVRFAYPIEQTCCGQPAFNAGHWSEASALAQHFAKTFEDYRWIVVPSGSCGAMARVFFDQLEPHGPAARIGARVYDLASFLVDVMGVTDVGARFPHAVTYHDGCHGRRELQCTAATLALLANVKELEYRELPFIGECCGFGGLFSVKYDELSSSMGVAKSDRALSTGAEYLVSGDSSCLMHVGGILKHRNDPLKTIHLAEVLAHT